MAQKYDVVVTNPPYMGASGMSEKLSGYVKTYYPDSKSDLFAVFIERCGQMTKMNGYQAMITQHAWMFLSSFEKLRTKLLATDIVNMAHLGARAFEEIGGEVVQTTAFICRKSNIENYIATYKRLVDYNSQQAKEDAFLDCPLNTVHYALKSNFSKIPGSPIAYWVSEAMLLVFKNGRPMVEYAVGRKGLVTGNDGLYLKLWFEVDKHSFSVFNGFKNTKWKPCNKGGNYRKWFGNNDFIVNWGNAGEELADHRWPDGRQRSSLRNSSYFFKEAITWTYITSGTKCFRYYPNGFAFAGTGPGLFPRSQADLMILLGYTNSSVFDGLLKLIGSSTISLESGEVERVPVIMDDANRPEISIYVKENINLCKTDWDAYETSWDFKRHPLV